LYEREGQNIFRISGSPTSNRAEGPMRIIAVANHKGGVGKTTTTVNTAAALARMGLRVAALDLDPQAHLTYSLGFMAHALPRSVADGLRGTADLGRAALEAGPLTLIPASLELAGVEQELAGAEHKELRLRAALRGLGSYDALLVDCPPNLGLLTVNALAAATELLIPLLPEFLAMQSLGLVLNTAAVVRQRLNPGLGPESVVFTRFQKNRTLHREVRSTTRRHLGSAVLDAAIRENISLAEAPSHGQDIFRYKPASSGAADYLALAKELWARSQP
jgi:chromosome partitioning protein